MKNKYRVRNWKEYNEALVKRGSITLWLDEESLKQWQEPRQEGKRGRPQFFSDMAIICGLTIKAIFHLTYRATEGFLRSFVQCQQLELEVPDYTLLCKRQKQLRVKLPKKPLNEGEGLHLVVDSTGIKVYGEGEWKVRVHGWVKHRLWRKLHLAVNSKTQEIETFELTDLGVQDCEGFSLLVDKVGDEIRSAKGDGAYDRFSCYEVAEKRKFEFITPPQRNAVTSDERRKNKKKASREAIKKRDEAVREIRELGRKEWKIKSGYHRRSLAETAMFRVKTLLGNRLSTRTMEHQKIEMAIWCRVINKMTQLGMPNTVAC